MCDERTTIIVYSASRRDSSCPRCCRRRDSRRVNRQTSCWALQFCVSCLDYSLNLQQRPNYRLTFNVGPSATSSISDAQHRKWRGPDFRWRTDVLHGPSSSDTFVFVVVVIVVSIISVHRSRGDDDNSGRLLQRRCIPADHVPPGSAFRRRAESRSRLCRTADAGHSVDAVDRPQLPIVRTIE